MAQPAQIWMQYSQTDYTPGVVIKFTSLWILTRLNASAKDTENLLS